MQNNHKLTSALSLDHRFFSNRMEILKFLKHQITKKSNSNRKFLVFPHHTFTEEHFAKIMKTHNTFCIEMAHSDT